MSRSWVGRGAGTAVILLCLSLLAPAAGALRVQSFPTENALASGFHQLEFSTGDGTSLRCSLWVPSIEEGVRVPLVLALHWGGEVTPYFSMTFLRSLAVPGLKELGAIIVAPDCPGDGWTDPASERVVLAVLDYAVRRWPVDRSQVVVTGYSLGGIGAWYFASRHPESFSAAVPIAGRPPEDLDVRVPVYAINGKRDEVIDLEPTERAIDALRAEGARAELVVVKGATHYQTQAFVKPLKKAVSWLQRLWEAEP